MTELCPSAQFLGCSVLEGYQLQFRGDSNNAYATIIQNQQCKVPVTVWNIANIDEVALDKYEDFPHLYVKEYHVVQLGDTPVEGMLYKMIDKEQNKPSEQYYMMLVEAYKEHNFALELLESVLEN